MDIDWIQTFVEAAKHENLHTAAERLHLTQPTVTQQIHKLEQMLGVELFDRGGRRVRLSRAGQRWLPHAEKLLTHYRMSIEEMNRWRQGFESELRLAVSPLVATTWLPHWLSAFQQSRPDVSFSVIVTESVDIPDAILGYAADIGLTRMAVSHPDLSTHDLYADPVVCVTPTLTDELHANTWTLSDWLHHYPVLTHNHPEYWDDLHTALQRAYPFVRAMRVSQVHVTVHWVAQGLGISFLPHTTVRRELLRGSIQELNTPELTLPIAWTRLLVYRRASELAKSFADFVVSYMAQRV